MSIYLVILITLVAALVASAAQLMYKKGLTKRLGSVRDIVLAFRSKWILLGFAGYMLSLVIYLYALAHADLSIVYPTFASVFIFVMLISVFALMERMSPARALGVLAIFAGIAIVAYTI